jgi:hypothetical protein
MDGGKRTMRALVPGCGAGYDLISLFLHFNKLIATSSIQDAVVIGLDLSPSSLSRAAEVLDSSVKSATSRSGPTQVHLAEGDYFKKAASWRIHSSFGGILEETDCDNSICGLPSHFDFVFDYTFFCALPPSLRESWGRRTAELLCRAPDSRLLTLMFPVIEKEGESKDDPAERRRTMRGPPYPVLPSDYRGVLEPHGIFTESPPYSSAGTDPTREGKELVCWWRRFSSAP